MAVLHLIIIAVLSLAAYSNTFSVPFQWDEGFFIKENPAIKDLTYFCDTSKAADLEKEHKDRRLHLKSRYVTYLTFALNYRFHGYDVFGYHLLNFAVHLANALLVYALVILTFRTPFLAKLNSGMRPEHIAFFSGLVFAVHPIQTEAVTYIYQRLASLVTLFYLASLVSYILSRLSESKKEKYLFYALSLTSAVFAMKTKENAFTLPFVIAIYEIFFFKDKAGNRALNLIPFALTLAIIPLTLIDSQKPLGELMDDVDAATSRTKSGLSRAEYLFTQFRVIVTYLRLLIYPADQVLDYYFPPSHSFWEPKVLLSFLLLSSLAVLGIRLFIRSRKGPVVYRVISFGIFFFFVTLSIESSIFPINMIIDEYRVYLPSVGLLLSAATGLSIANPAVTARRYLSLIMIIASIFTIATFKRNQVWESRISLWTDVTKKSPLNPRGHNNLADSFIKEGRYKEAASESLKTVKLDPTHAGAYNNLSFVMRLLGDFDRAIEYGIRAVELNPESSSPHNNLGNAYAAKGMYDRAIENYLVVLRLDPDFKDTYNNLGVAYMSKGMTETAIAHYKKALELSPDYADAYNNIGNAYMSKKNTDEAEKSYNLAIKYDPRHIDAHNNLGLVYALTNRMDLAEKEFMEAARINPSSQDAHLNLGRVFISKKDYASAEKELKTVLRINPNHQIARQLLAYLRSRQQ